MIFARRRVSWILALALLVTGARAEGAYKTSWTNSTPAATCTVTFSVAPAAGDIIIAWALTDTTAAGDLDSTPSGYTQDQRAQSTNDNATLLVVHKKAAGGEASVSFTSSSGNLSICGASSFDSIDGTNPLDVAVQTFASSTAATTMDISTTPVTNGAQLVYVAAFDAGSSDYTFTYSTTAGSTGAWTTQVDQNSTFYNAALGEATQTTAGALTARCTSTSGGRLGTLFALRPSATATLTLDDFQWGFDDANEAGHTWAEAENTNISTAAGSLLLRAQVDATGDPAAVAYTLRAQKNGSGGYTVVPVGAATSPTLSWGAAGTIAYSSANGSSVAPTYPSGITTNSTLIMVLGQKPSSANSGTATTPSGWTLQAQITGATDGDTGGYTSSLAADTGNTNLYVYSKDTVTGSESGTLSVTVGTNSVSWANIYRIEASDRATFSYAAASGKDTTAGNVSIATGSMAIASGDLVLGAMVIPTDVTTPAQFSAEALSQSGTTFGAVTEIQEPDSGNGNDIGGFLVYASATAGSGSGAVTMTATAGGTTTNVRGPGIVLRIRASAVNNEVYVSASANIAGGGEATTARLTAPGGKSTSDFVTGRRWDDENGTDTTDITTDDYTEVEWSVTVANTLGAGEYYEFRVYAGAAALNTYTYTPRWTIPSGASFVPAIVNSPLVQ